MSSPSASRHSSGVSASSPFSPGRITRAKSRLGLATVGTPRSPASRYFRQLFASVNGFSGSSGARLTSTRARSQGTPARAGTAIRSTRSANASKRSSRPKMADGHEADVLVGLERPEDRVGRLEEVAVVRRRSAQVRDDDFRRLACTRDARASVARRTISSLTAFGIGDDEPDDLRRSLVQRLRAHAMPLPPPAASGGSERRSRRTPGARARPCRRAQRRTGAPRGSKTRSSESKITGFPAARARATSRSIASSHATRWSTNAA